jgi:hypothetical protein|nr:MAG TPA: hypothetical protein [Bacteriophage sp.]
MKTYYLPIRVKGGYRLDEYTAEQLLDNSPISYGHINVPLVFTDKQELLRRLENTKKSYLYDIEEFRLLKPPFIAKIKCRGNKTKTYKIERHDTCDSYMVECFIKNGFAVDFYDQKTNECILSIAERRKLINKKIVKENSIEYKSGYVVKRLNQTTFALTRVGATNSNPFMVVDGEPVFDSMLYVNPTTIKLCKSAYKKLNEVKK